MISKTKNYFSGPQEKHQQHHRLFPCTSESAQAKTVTTLAPQSHASHFLTNTDNIPNRKEADYKKELCFYLEGYSKELKDLTF